MAAFTTIESGTYNIETLFGVIVLNIDVGYLLSKGQSVVKGQVLNYSVQTNSGIISGDDGNRYTFNGPEWREGRVPVRGMYVDFKARGTAAVGIYISGGTGTTYGVSGFPVYSKSKIAAGLFAIFLGGLGIHKFYLGYTTQGVVLLAGSIAGFVLAFVIIGFFILLGIGVICLIEGIIYLSQSDEEFESVYVTGRKPWF